MTLTVRPPKRADFAAIVAVGEAFDRALTGTGDWSEEDVAHDWRALADPERDAWVIEDAGRIVGYATSRTTARAPSSPMDTSTPTGSGGVSARRS